MNFIVMACVLITAGYLGSKWMADMIIDRSREGLIRLHTYGMWNYDTQHCQSYETYGGILNLLHQIQQRVSTQGMHVDMWPKDDFSELRVVVYRHNSEAKDSDLTFTGNSGLIKSLTRDVNTLFNLHWVEKT